MQNNNLSKSICKEVCEKYDWVKEGRRNVVVYNGKKWSFSVSSAQNKSECRQVYEDTVGFITQMPSGKLVKFPVTNFSLFPVSRITAGGIRAHNVVIKDMKMMQAI